MDTLSSGLEECPHQIFKVDFDFSKIEDRCSPSRSVLTLPAGPRELLGSAVLSEWGCAVRAGAVSLPSALTPALFPPPPRNGLRTRQYIW